MVEASVANPLASLGDRASSTISLGVTYQVGAVLLVGCLGGKNAGALSQIAYLSLGLSPWFPVFAQGGRVELHGPSLFWLSFGLYSRGLALWLVGLSTTLSSGTVGAKLFLGVAGGAFGGIALFTSESMDIGGVGTSDDAVFLEPPTGPVSDRLCGGGAGLCAATVTLLLTQMDNHFRFEHYGWT